MLQCSYTFSFKNNIFLITKKTYNVWITYKIFWTFKIYLLYKCIPRNKFFVLKLNFMVCTCTRPMSVTYYQSCM